MKNKIIKIEDKEKKEREIEKKKYSKERMKMNKQRLNKLYNDYQKFKNKIENKKKELSKEEIKDCSFSPKIDKYSKILIKNNPNYSKPIFLRNNDKKDFYKKKHEINFTHIPKINKNYNNNLDIYNRLYNKTKIKNKEYNDYENSNDCPFRPITNCNFEKSHKIKLNFENILKREILLNEYISQQKINLNNNYINHNENIKLSFTQNTSCTSKSKYSTKKENQKVIEPYLDKFNRKIFKSFKVNRSLSNIKTNNKKYKNINNSFIQNKNDKSKIKNKYSKNNKSFLVDYINKKNNKINNYSPFRLTLYNSKNNKFFNEHYMKNTNNINQNIKENV